MHQRRQRGRRATAAAVVAAWVLVLAGTLGAGTAGAAQPGAGPARSAPDRVVSGPHPSVPGGTDAQVSTNWSGLVDEGGTFTGVQAGWVVPAVQTRPYATDSSTWIGIGGVTDPSLIQAGTDQEASGGGTGYTAWIGASPAGPVTEFAVSPGDQIDASITAGTPGSWTVTITDLTLGRSHSQTIADAVTATSAEWIEEAPTVGISPTPLADYGSVTFTGMDVEEGGAPVVAIPVEMSNLGSDAIISYPGTVVGSSLTVTYGAPDHGYWLVASDGGIFSFGAARFFGSTAGTVLQRPVTGISPTPDRRGYWLVAADGGVFAYGDAGYVGSIPGLGIAPAGSTGPGTHLDQPIVAVVPSVDGGGYLMLASDGGVFAFGDAHFAGSCPGIGGCNGRAVALLPDAGGLGYWLVTSTGAVYAFGGAPYDGGAGTVSSPITSAVRTPDGGGYYLLAVDGGVFPFGDAVDFGTPTVGTEILTAHTAIVATASGDGYWVAGADGGIDGYGFAPYDGSMAGKPLNAPVVGAVGW